MTDRPRILVIDDDPLFRKIILAMLQRNFTVSAAAEGSEGYFKALENPPDAAIIDIHMPGWNGLKTIQAMQGHPSLARVRIVVMTADASEATLQAAMTSGADDYLLKTRLCREELLLKLERLLPGVELHAASVSTLEPASAALRAPAGLLVRSFGQPAAANQPALQKILDSWE
jgi:CheY-like chemotaxis protein